MDNVSVKTRHYSRLNNHWKEVKDRKAILADQHFESKVVIYSTIIDRLTNTNTLFFLDSNLTWLISPCQGNFENTLSM